MRHYDFNAIKESGDCRRFAEEQLGIMLSREGRCAAVWRGGKNPSSVAIDRDQWYDHGNGEGGSIIDLCAIAKFHGRDQAAFQAAQELLGSWLGLPELRLGPAVSPVPTRYDELIASGYQEKKRYDYKDESGVVKHTVIRLEHPDGEHRKEFVQRTPSHWGLGDVELIPYNLAAVRSSEYVIIVEGEKDADTLIELGFVATTICGGAKKWHAGYVEYFLGKSVIILPDNDPAGRAHGKMIASDLLNAAKDVKLLIVSRLPKGDVTDYLTKESGTLSDLTERIKDAPFLKESDLADAAQEVAIQEAKEANSRDFSNYIANIRQTGKRTVTEKEPKQMNDLIVEIHRRFLGFPRKVGEQMFDHDRDTGEIYYIRKSDDLFSWIARKSRRRVDWAREANCVTKGEMFSGVLASCRRYEAISYVPDWPLRSDVYYAHEPLPEPDAEHRYFKGMIDFFCPANDYYRVLLCALFTAPLFYKRGIPRPLWIIDSVDGAGSGKTKVVDAMSELYGCAPVSTSESELKKNFTELIKRVVSSEGRQSRLLLLDNIVGSFSCPELADLVTKTEISGRPAYGSGEETRPNNLTYIITANSATVDNDLASRAYYLLLRRPEYSASWLSTLLHYIRDNRMKILSDAIDILSNHRVFDMPPVTRCPEFETRILQAHCQDTEEYSNVIKTILSDKAETNVEDDKAKIIEEVIRYNLMEISSHPHLNPDTDRVFIRSEALEKWLEKEGSTQQERNKIQLVRNLANTGLLPTVDKKLRRYPTNGRDRRSGILWSPAGATEQSEIRIIGLVGRGKIGIVYGV